MKDVVTQFSDLPLHTALKFAFSPKHTNKREISMSPSRIGHTVRYLRDTLSLTDSHP